MKNRRGLQGPEADSKPTNCKEFCIGNINSTWVVYSERSSVDVVNASSACQRFREKCVIEDISPLKVSIFVPTRRSIRSWDFDFENRSEFVGTFNTLDGTGKFSRLFVRWSVQVCENCTLKKSNSDEFTNKISIFLKIVRRIQKTRIPNVFKKLLSRYWIDRALDRW